MTLDLDELIVGWDCPPGETRARLVTGRDGEEVVQLRIDLGVMQMTIDGRPDGQRCHGLPTAHDYVTHELRVVTGELPDADWLELERELVQVNYRRVAFTTLAEDALTDNDAPGARRFLDAALRDTATCLTDLDLLANHPASVREHGSLKPTLIFDRARLRAQAAVVAGQFEDAIEEAEHGASELDTLLTNLGYEEEDRTLDPGISYLLELSRRLRDQYGVPRTLRERLADAIAHDDFELAAELHEQLRRRLADHPN